MCPTQIFDHLEYMGRKGAIDCSCDDEDARIKPSDATVRLEAKNFTATAKHESTIQA